MDNETTSVTAAIFHQKNSPPQKIVRFRPPAAIFVQMDTVKATSMLSEYVLKGSEEAFRELVEGYACMVLGVARQRLGNHSQWAEDVAQATFIALARQASSITDGSHLAAWLHRVTCRTAVDVLRRETRRQRREQQASMNNNSFTSHSGSCLTEALNIALDSLKPDERRVIALRFLEGLDFRAVGKAMALSEDACRMRLNRALDRLRHKLAALGVLCSPAALSQALASIPVTELVAPAFVAQWTAAAISGKTATSPLWVYLMTTKTKLIAAAAVVALTVPATLYLTRQRDLATTTAGRLSVNSTVKALPEQTSQKKGTSSSSGHFRPDKKASFATLLKKAIALCNEKKDPTHDEENEIVDAIMNEFTSAQLTAEEIPAALAELENQGDKEIRALVGAALVGMWARTDGLAAMNYAKEKLADLDRIHPLSTPMREWSKREPDAAVAWITAKDNDSLLKRWYPRNISVSYNLAVPLLSGLIDSSRFDLIGKLTTNTELSGQIPYLLIEKIRGMKNPQSIYDGLAGLPQDQRIKISGGLGYGLVDEADTANLTTWVESLRDPQERAAAAINMADRLMQLAVSGTAAKVDGRLDDPVAIMNLALRNTPDEEQRAEAMGKMMQRWVHYAKAANGPQLTSAGEWLAAQPEGPETDAARDAYARKLSRMNPAAARKWAETIHNPQLKENAIAEIESLEPKAPR